MNNEHMQQIFDNYIQKFEFVNNSQHQEYYKWQIANIFHDEMDKVLAAPAEEFSAKLGELKKKTENLIDSYTQPFGGLVYFAKTEPDKVREMFKKLYADDGGDLIKRRQKVTEFLKECEELRENYSPDSYLFKNDMHSVTGYMFLYDPDHNYLFKSTHALAFADCIEFYDDWKSGDNVDLAVYYRMCDQLVEAIKNNEALLKTDASRYENGWGVDPKTLHPDKEKHILAFDIIYCCSSYELFDGITFKRPKSGERHLMQERKEKAMDAAEKLIYAQQDWVKLLDGKDYLNKVFEKGNVLKHKTKGEGTVTDNNGTVLTVTFLNGEIIKFGTFLAAANGIITSDEDGYKEKIDEYKDYLKREEAIRSALTGAEKEYYIYGEYLD